MARETLRALDADVERLLLAGAALASTDEGLASRGAKLEALSVRVPALARVAERARAAASATGGGRARELLDLSATCEQVRRAQAAAVVPEGEALALAVPPPIETPLAAEEAHALAHEIRRARNSERGLEALVARGAATDLRLLRAWVRALGHALAGRWIITEVLPRYGEAAVATLRAALDLRGDPGDGQRLLALARMEGSAARELVAMALRDGSPAVRPYAVEALEMLAAAGDAEARAWLERDEAVAAAVEALGSDDDPVVRAAVALLSRTPNAGATGAVVTLLGAPWPRRRALAACEVLGVRGDAEARATLARLFESHGDRDVRWSAALGLVRGGDPATLARVVARVGEFGDEERRRLLADVLAQDAARAFELLAPQLPSPATARTFAPPSWTACETILLAVRERAAQGLDPRWKELCLFLLGHPRLGPYAVTILRALNDPSVVEAFADGLRDPRTRAPALRALATLGDPRAVPHVLAVLEQRDAGSDRAEAYRALATLGDRSAVPALKELARRPGLPDAERITIRELLARLGRGRDER